jgi:hypothetical protein
VDVVPLVALGADVGTNLEPEPVAAGGEADRTGVPEQGGQADTFGTAEDQERGRHDEDDEAVHHQQVRLAAIRVLELPGGQDLVRQGADGDAALLGAGNLALGDLLERLTFLEEILCTLFVRDVDEDAADDQQHHQDDVRLHGAGHQCVRESCEGVCEHRMVTPPSRGTETASSRF